jgi:DNA-directed RNA polymerase subunit F
MDFIRVTRRIGRDQRFQSSNIGAFQMQIDRKRGLHSLFEENKRLNKKEHSNAGIIKEIKDKEYSSVLDRLDKFSFKSSSINSKSQTQSTLHQFSKFRPQKLKTYKEDLTKSSNLFVTTYDSSQFSSKPKEASQLKIVNENKKHYLSSSDEEGPKKAVNTL